MLPTGAVRDELDGVAVTLVDNGMPVVVMRADALGIDGDEDCATLEADAELRQRLERIRLAAGARMNLGDVTDTTVPKLALVSPPRADGDLCTRSFIPHRCHDAVGVLAAVSIATAALLPGTPAHEVLGRRAGHGVVVLEHPTGTFDTAVELDERRRSPTVRRAGIVRTARTLMDGVVYPREYTVTRTPRSPAPTRTRTRRGAFRPPPGACDAHCHVFGPAARFPFAADRAYTPPDSGIDDFEALQERLGLSRAVFVQASCHGTDNSAMLDAIERGRGRYAGVAMIDESFTAADIGRLHDAGVRGTRFNFVRHLGGAPEPDVFWRLVERVAALRLAHRPPLRRPRPPRARAPCWRACRARSSSTTWLACRPRTASTRSRSRPCSGCWPTSGAGSRSRAPSG